MEGQFPIFRLEEANALLPEIIRITEEVRSQLEDLRSLVEAETALRGEDVQQKYQPAIDELLNGWSEEISALGVQPKGYFTCDFVSPNPEMLFCWNYGETEIGHTHKVTESFKDRQPICFPEMQGFQFSLN